MGLVGGLVGALVDFAVDALVPAVDQSWQIGLNSASLEAVVHHH